MQAAGQLAQFLVGLRELVEDRVHGGRVRHLVAQHPQRQPGAHQPLLRAVVEVALEPPALVVGGAHEPRARLEQPLVGVGARDRQRGQPGEPGQAFLGVLRQRLAVEGGDDERAPDRVLDRDRRGGAGPEPDRPHGLPHVPLRVRVLVEARRQPRVAHEAQRASPAQLEAQPRRQHRARVVAPAPDDHGAAAIEAHDRPRAHAADPRGLLGGRLEHRFRRDAAGDEHGDFAQRALELGLWHGGSSSEGRAAGGARAGAARSACGVRVRYGSSCSGCTRGSKVTAMPWPRTWMTCS